MVDNSREQILASFPTGGTGIGEAGMSGGQSRDVVSGTSDQPRNNYYNKMALFWEVMKWFIPIFLTTVATIVITLWIVYLTNLQIPLIHLDEKTEQIRKDVDKQQNILDDIKKIIYINHLDQAIQQAVQTKTN